MREVMFYLVLSLSCLALSAQKVPCDSSLCAQQTAEIVAEKLQTQLALFPQEKTLPAFGQTCVCTGRAGPVQSLSGGCRFASVGDEEWLCICGIG